MTTAISPKTGIRGLELSGEVGRGAKLLSHAGAPALDERHAQWLNWFQERHGRRPTVLHIGNIGNNAYILARALNAVGVDCDVLAHDYYHVMGCPEWEESDFVGDIQDQFYPAWESVDLRGFRRPPWFAQGPLDSCLQYLHARRTGDDQVMQQWWCALQQQRGDFCAAQRQESQQTRTPERRSRVVRALWWLSRRLSGKDARTSDCLARIKISDRFCELESIFRAAFPSRTDQFELADLAHFAPTFARWQEVLQHYDLIVGYATDGLYPMLASRPYIAFEHGTIRSIPFEPTPAGRLCALTYRMANHCFITNADNHVAAQKLGLKRFSFLPHPLNEAAFSVGEGADSLRADLRRRLGSEFVILHPSRQHWTSERHPNWEKGNDVLIEGFARFVREVYPRAGAVFVNWGQTVEQSRALLASRGLTDRVLWIEPQSNRQLLAYIQATDVLADQFFLGAFGGTMPKALMLGRPNLIYLDEERHRWCLPVMPPVINARMPEDVFEGLTRLYRDCEYAQELAAAGKRWYRQYHSLEVVVDRFIDVMRRILA